MLTKVIRERGGSVDEENVEKVSLKNKPIQEGKSIRENKPVPDSKPIHDTKPIRESKSTNETQTFKENKVIKEVEPIVEKSALESIFDESTSDNKDANVEAKNDDDGDDLEEEDDEDEEEIIPTSKYRHNSPSFSVVVPDKNKTVIPDSDATSYIHEETSHAEQTPVKHEETPLKHVETEKERLERIKCEEEYLQRKLQNKRRKELELIHKLQEDERKRVEEKVKLELAEQAKLKEVTKQKELEEERRVREFELERRRRIRELYPLGLKLINFNKTAIPEDVTNDFLPLYYMVRDGIKYVLDLQLLVICQDTSMLVHSAGDRSIRITDQDEKLQLWNIHRRTFLFGGDSDREMSFHQARMSQKLKFEGGEFTKFCQLPMSWTPLDNVPVEWRDKLQLLMCQVSDWKSVTPAHSSLQPPQPSQQLRSQPLQQQPLQPLPLKLQHRPHVARCLQQEIDCERQPMW